MIYYRKKKSGKQKPVKDESDLPRYYAAYNLKVYDSKHRKVFTRKQKITPQIFSTTHWQQQKTAVMFKMIHIHFLYNDNHANIDYGSQKLGNYLGVQ